VPECPFGHGLSILRMWCVFFVGVVEAFILNQKYKIHCYYSTYSGTVVTLGV
jgi:hypothetical protein